MCYWKQWKKIGAKKRNLEKLGMSKEKAWMNANPDMLTNNGGNDMVAAVSAMGYDAYFVALEALKAAGTTDSKAVNTALWDVKYTGVSGEITFAEPGDAVRNVAYIKTANTETGAWDFVTVQSVE